MHQPKKNGERKVRKIVESLENTKKNTQRKKNFKG